MKIVTLPSIPNPDDAQYRGNVLAYNRAVYSILTQWRGTLEKASQLNDTPMNQNFVLGSYTLSTSMSGTSTGTDVNNFILSVCNAMISKGLMKQNK